MELQFSKMEGLGNDFIMLDDRDGQIVSKISYPDLAEKLCSRHFGIGADGIILMLNAQDDSHDIKFRIYNSDGSQAQMCGNGMRCFAKLIYDEGVLNSNIFKVDTKAGTVIPEVLVNDDGQVTRVKVDMGEPILVPGQIPFIHDSDKAVEVPLEVGRQRYTITPVSMGNPHAVIFVDDVSQIDIKEIGPRIEVHPRFPEKTNVEFIEVVSRNELIMKVWERGAGITLACGTGACASLVAANLTDRTDENATIHLDGGDLEIRWEKQTNHIFKTGPANLVFTGTIEI
jgi:diaminopimelate epimerase